MANRLGQSTGDSNFGFMQRSETWLSATFLLTLVVLIIPLPTFLLDMFLACNLAAAIMLLLVTLGAKQPLDVSVFPSLLLLLTLFRLALNVATTRQILLNADAGKLILTFGDFVVGGNLIVGIVVFLILVTIQFIVITKGATRISEVNARFTLDAMPGKQMAIDAELNSGAIDEKEAREKRGKLTREAEFYGAMDGASKYVRGDAIAGLVIIVVNIVGGVLLGVSNGQSVAEALRIYSLLTIGDGLVSQIPALVIATSAGILVTKSSSESSLGDEIGNQASLGHRSLYIGIMILLFISLTPGFPKIPFLLIAAGIWLFVQKAKQREVSSQEQEEPEPTAGDSPASPEEENLNRFLSTERIVIEIGAGLISIVEPQKGKGIAERISTMRTDMAEQHGFWIPQARIRDNLRMGVNDYRIVVNGRQVATGELIPNHFMAINPGNVKTEIEGISTKDPAFELPAKWINEGDRRRAEMIGYTVVDAATVLITHLGEVLRKYSHELLSREDMQKLLNKLKETSPATVDEIKPDTVRPSVLHQVLVHLLSERVPITSLEKIVEAAIHFGPQHKDAIQLTEKVRMAIGALICNPFQDQQGRVRVIILEPKLEHTFRQMLSGNSITLAPASLERLVTVLQTKWESARLKDKVAAVLVDSSIRYPLRQTLIRSLGDISIVAYNEVPTGVLIDAMSMVRYDEVIHPEDNINEFQLMTNEPSKDPEVE